MADQFSRSLDTIHAEFVMACSRRALARANLNATIAEAARVDADLLRYEWHIELCDRQITGLLDEAARSKASDQMPSGSMA